MRKNNNSCHVSTHANTHSFCFVVCVCASFLALTCRHFEGKCSHGSHDSQAQHCPTSVHHHHQQHCSSVVVQQRQASKGGECARFPFFSEFASCVSRFPVLQIRKTAILPINHLHCTAICNWFPHRRPTLQKRKEQNKTTRITKNTKEEKQQPHPLTHHTSSFWLVAAETKIRGKGAWPVLCTKFAPTSFKFTHERAVTYPQVGFSTISPSFPFDCFLSFFFFFFSCFFRQTRLLSQITCATGFVRCVS